MTVPEMKYFDSLVTSTSIPSSTNWTATELDPTTLNCLFAPTQGTAINNRVGRKVSIRKLKITGQITAAAQADATAADAAAHVRLICYMDQQSNGQQSQGEDLMDGSSGTTAGSVNAFQSLANFGRFKVLSDKHIVLQNPNMTYDGTNIEQAGLIKYFKMSYVFKKPLIVHFNATNGGTVADIVDNSFHVIANTTSAALAPALTYNARISFVDA